MMRPLVFALFFFFNDTATTEIYTLSLHDALPNCVTPGSSCRTIDSAISHPYPIAGGERDRSEEHTSELQSRPHLVCRLLLEKKKKNTFLVCPTKKKKKKKRKQ